ncbi:hypothetical protein [Parasitella parasitica]|uniref:Uncharacterized protein n=1 Tax=Parasitella parasitica TaxID=35722 RepID=A0A0B7NGW2_9FUNG|nr:hypothetical protein [Parasitella parasitica]
MNKVVEICPFMAMAFHFFWRSHNNKESSPSFNTNKVRFRLKLIHCVTLRTTRSKKPRTKGDARQSSSLKGEYDYESSSDEEDQEEGVFKILAETAISKTGHTRIMKNAFADADLFVKKKVTHVPRRSGASMASLAGVPEDEIRLHLRDGRLRERFGVSFALHSQERAIIANLPTLKVSSITQFKNSAAVYLLAKFKTIASYHNRDIWHKRERFKKYISKQKASAEISKRLLGEFKVESAATATSKMSWSARNTINIHVYGGS